MGGHDVPTLALLFFRDAFERTTILLLVHELSSLGIALNPISVGWILNLCTTFDWPNTTMARTAILCHF